jgi:hypothetical protein
MPEVVVGKLRQGKFLAGSLQTFARTFDRNNPVFRLRFCLRLQSRQKLAQPF